MTEDIDIYRAAHLMLKQHGDQALHKAAERIAALALAGDQDGVEVWKRILRAIDGLSAPPTPDDLIN
jgi:hypothetical protein